MNKLIIDNNSPNAARLDHIEASTFQDERETRDSGEEKYKWNGQGKSGFRGNIICSVFIQVLSVKAVILLAVTISTNISPILPTNKAVTILLSLAQWLTDWLLLHSFL